MDYKSFLQCPEFSFRNWVLINAVITFNMQIKEAHLNLLFSRSNYHKPS